MVEYTVMTVTAFKGTVISSVGVFIKIDTKFNYMLQILSRFTDESMNSINIILESACNKSVVLMVLDIIRRRVIHSGNTALSERRITETEFTLAYNKNSER